jgi:hypothetical protein
MPQIDASGRPIEGEYSPSTPITLPTTNPFSSMDQTVSYSSKVDIQMAKQASIFRKSEETDWVDETNMENDFE